MTDERLTNIEIKIAHQEHALEEMSSVIYEQQKTIDNLEKMLNSLTKRLQEAMGDGGSEIRGNEKPPHY